MTVWMRGSAQVRLLIITVAAICALMLAWPGQTVTTKYVNDLFIFLDGVHRINSGQIPNRDFHTALGPLVYYAPALGYWLSGTFGGAMPVGMALITAALALPASHILGSRLRPAVALPLGIYLILVAAVPMNLGESVSALSFAMFYNRIGWAGLGFLLVMYLRPERPGRSQNGLDAACAAFLVILMLYIKISYGLVGIGFLILLLLDARQRLWSISALGLTAIGCLVVEVFWGGTKAHIADLLLAGEVSGSLKPVDQIVQLLLGNLPDFTLFFVFAGLILWRTRSIRDFLFFGFSAGSGFLLIMQNFQNSGIVTLMAASAVAVERLARSDRQAYEPRRRPLTAGAQLLLFAFVLPGSLQYAAALGLHTGLASLDRGQAAPLPNFGEVKLVRLWNDGDYPAFSRYFASLADGARALSSLEQETDHVLVLDFVSPFSAGLGLEAPTGDSTWYHWGRTVNEHSFLPAKSLFDDVRIIMEPKWPVDGATTEGLKAIYAEFINDQFEFAGETADWRIYVLRAPPAETVSRSNDSDRDGEEDDIVPSGG
ncbi:hypothetical protein [Microvirga makkahensis]|uniref:Glycosyltransferase RgtA/B/C/D-like domain-containing protein n=1 Tax=Microvirga makkahensis TaxID=1128670 RepID=A0A7X3SNI8_9HYPH|nr:hypothetical protein [Microvirga makkahensis]MXQ11451.1 hypothetical protein [Microvirga makkahensis]